MKATKRILAILLAVMMIVGMLSLTANAEGSANFAFPDPDGDCTIECQVGDIVKATVSYDSNATAIYWVDESGEEMIVLGSETSTDVYLRAARPGSYSFQLVVEFDDYSRIESEEYTVVVSAATPIPEGLDSFSVAEANTSALKTVTVSGATINGSEYDVDNSNTNNRIYTYNVYLDSETPDSAELTLFFTPNSFSPPLPTRSDGWWTMCISPTYSTVGIDRYNPANRVLMYDVTENAISSLTVTLNNGAAQAEVFAYTQNSIDQDDIEWDSDFVGHYYANRLRDKFVFNFIRGEAVEKEPLIVTNATSSAGQFENVQQLNVSNNPSYVTDRKTYLVVSHQTDSVTVGLTFDHELSAVTVNDSAEGITIDGNTCSFVVTTAQAETINTITATPSGDNVEGPITYTLVCLKQQYDDMPDKVAGYLCIGSQFTNIKIDKDDYGLRPVRSLMGTKGDTSTTSATLVSLGNFGGYIIYEYDTPITDNPNNPYGIDFITFGNSVDSSTEFAEPGQVWVSEDGDTWYALAGSMHYDDSTDWDYYVTYTKSEDGRTSWVDKDNNETAPYSGYYYPTPENYPYYSFSESDKESMTMRGIALIPNEIEAQENRPPFPDFGYTDVGRRGTILPNEDESEWTAEERAEKYGRNLAGNPYLGSYQGSYNGQARRYLSVTDGMDLAWAVDATGQPVSFENGIKFVKIVTASCVMHGTGEKSTEVSMVRVAQPNSENVGTTSAPSSIKIDGVALELVEGQNVYSAMVDGPFKVEVAVDEPENTNIYINSTRATSVNFNGMPLHKIVRVIVQQGEKEPVIYVINLTETTETPAASATLTLDANGGTVNGSATYTMNFDANMAGDPLPTPLPPDNNSEFAGWYAGLQPVDSIPAEVEDVTYVAHWAPKQVEPGEETVDVSFRLIGSTRASGDVDYEHGDTKGAEYVTWIATKPYTMPAGSTVADLIVRACNDAGLTQSNALGGYVASVTAPASYGGYTLSEFTNGPRSGWMYTIGEAGTQHPGRGVAEKVLSDGDVVILHYVNDYAWEVADWSVLGGSGWPSLYGDDTQYLNGWMQAEDDDPPPYVPPETPTTPEEPKPVFKDVPEDAWFAEAVAWAVENGITTGTTATTFEPELDCTRGQVVTFLWRAAGEPKASAANPFTDVAEGSFYYDAVLWAVEQGITTGTTATTFEPDAPCTRGQVVTFLWRAAGKPISNSVNPFADVAEGSFYYDAVIWAVGSGVTTGTSATTFEPDLNCTRAQVVTFMWREAK